MRDKEIIIKQYSEFIRNKYIYIEFLRIDNTEISVDHCNGLIIDSKMVSRITIFFDSIPEIRLPLNGQIIYGNCPFLLATV